MYLVISKCVTAVKVSNFSGHYLRNSSTLDIGVLGYIGIVQHKEHSPQVLTIPPGTPCIAVAKIIFTNHKKQIVAAAIFVSLSVCLFSLSLSLSLSHTHTHARTRVMAMLFSVLDPTRQSIPATVENIADAVTHARFVGTDQSSDGVVLMKILQVYAYNFKTVICCMI